ncbi:MAG: aminotransferase class I/II-fold pyridoxal phosphate-dependent enzyme [Rhodopirellula sp.]|nr:aminotransferase class I/II-fold pyridoxal phosphate-dependent enzyme [Rhodopirellula sp.]
MKNSIEDCAIFGGSAEFPQPLHVGRPNIGSRSSLFRRINEILDRNWLTNDGPMDREFEQRLRDLTGASNCIAVSNATLGLQLLCHALNLTGEIIIPSFTFAASAHAFLWQGITPVFCDVKPGTFHLDVDQLESLRTDRTSAVLGVHTWGQACDTEAVTAFAAAHDLRVIFDAAHAIGCEHEGKPIGTFGDAEVFSFHATKCVNSFEGGAITTSNDDLAERLRLMRNFGFRGNDNVISIGINAKMNEVCAAMGQTSLDAYDEFVAHNQENARAFAEGLAPITGIDLFEPRPGQRHNWQYIVSLIDEPRFGLTRDELVAVLSAENVLARRYFYPGCHRIEPYRSLFPNAGDSLPNTEHVCENVLVLPTGTQLDATEARRICELMSFASAHAAEIRSRWSDESASAEMRTSD